MDNLVVQSEADQIWRNELIRQISKETRLPIPRVMMLTWAQFTSPNKIRTPTGREVELEKITAAALTRLPQSSRYIFSMTPFPPLIPDEYLEGARKYVADRQKAQNKRKIPKIRIILA